MRKSDAHARTGCLRGRRQNIYFRNNQSSREPDELYEIRQVDQTCHASCPANSGISIGIFIEYIYPSLIYLDFQVYGPLF